MIAERLTYGCSLSSAAQHSALSLKWEIDAALKSCKKSDKEKI
jgi:hypothetical protein